MAVIPPRFRRSSYLYDLPEELIAQEPLPERRASRLMVLERRGGIVAHTRFYELPKFLREGDCLVINDSKVFPARFFAQKATGGIVEFLVVSHQGAEGVALVRAHRGIKEGTVLNILDKERKPTETFVRILEALKSPGTVRFEVFGSRSLRLREVLDEVGLVPVPPYVRRRDASLEELDRERYQTVYATKEGSVAAPTAGFHFDEPLLAEIASKGVQILRVTLHVGPGTFKPIREEDIRLHKVDPEPFEIPEETATALNLALSEGRRIVGVGTTVVRTLESAFEGGKVRAGSGVAHLTILPGHKFRVVSAMLTNFHLPASSLIVLVSAFAGRKRILRAYREAIRLGYRFYSYGDAMAIF